MRSDKAHGFLIAVAAALQAAATPQADDIDQARWMQGGLASRGITRDGEIAEPPVSPEAELA